jgi:hypothetical protein
MQPYFFIALFVVVVVVGVFFEIGGTCLSLSALAFCAVEFEIISSFVIPR